MSRLAGHELTSEGAPHDAKGRPAYPVRYGYGTGGTGRGKCSCGALSGVLDSGTKRKAWHRGHKDEIREPSPEVSYPLTLSTFPEFRDALDALNYESGIDATCVTTGNGSTLWFAYCTDPDGIWFLETGDPAERIIDDCYDPLTLDAVSDRGPWTILWAPKSSPTNRIETLE